MWAMSPMFTVCHDERSRMREGRLTSAALTESASAAMRMVWKK